MHLSMLNVGFMTFAPFIGDVPGNFLKGLVFGRVLSTKWNPAITITNLSIIFMI
jgi:hypothetical protein